ncbi:histidine phosphatase superfamily [Tricharina praecox]|uniref:histidine phosphatase superfamily n=1 Tax=Tricharina praecox TaxID=43433 RepID=UPI0022210920|nr:histidine phosphatase superfamily [Tricharina praecox]XP_051344486.1 histidine phosphatase superfamily [Tricharina praecox]KAI5840626.1 histidine phosphatase superfamily [Tricharina praecox]KAI5858886.1 histidine phosphatase superfamily [Tricharina praecox]
MGKPRLIILCRHAQSVGNENRTIHQTVPDHRVPLTAVGQEQALAAGDKLARLLRPSDTLQMITSPYTRTRETTLGILSSPALKEHPNSGSIRVYEEPRIREQDFGNFQPCQAEMARMWHERAAYGHFFYRIPNGESAADAYDRVSGFNESLWRQFAEEDFPSVLVLVTHGLMTRIFLMKWYHYSVEYFEDLRNVDHCDFVVMKLNDQHKYDLQTELRTWSGYSREQEELRYKCPPANRVVALKASVWGVRKFGGCVDGCNHEFDGDRSMMGGHVMKAGRDFGGSRSGAASRAASHDSTSDDDDDEGIDEDLDAAGPDGAKNGNGMIMGGHPADVIERLKMEAALGGNLVNGVKKLQVRS